MVTFDIALYTSRRIFFYLLRITPFFALLRFTKMTQNATKMSSKIIAPDDILTFSFLLCRSFLQNSVHIDESQSRLPYIPYNIYSRVYHKNHKNNRCYIDTLDTINTRPVHDILILCYCVQISKISSLY